MRVRGERIYQARLQANMSRADLATRIRTLSRDRIKATERGIRRWEKEERGIQPNASSVLLIAEATGKAVPYFYAADDADEEESSLSLTRDLHSVIDRIVDARLSRERVA